MTKFIIQLEDGKYVERFYGASVLVTDKTSIARTYTKSDAMARAAKHNLTFTLIEANQNEGANENTMTKKANTTATETAAPAATTETIYARKAGKSVSRKTTLDAMTADLAGKYTEKTALKMLAKGKVLTAESGNRYATTLDALAEANDEVVEMPAAETVTETAPAVDELVVELDADQQAPVENDELVIERDVDETETADELADGNAMAVQEGADVAAVAKPMTANEAPATPQFDDFTSEQRTALDTVVAKQTADKQPVTHVALMFGGQMQVHIALNKKATKTTTVYILRDGTVLEGLDAMHKPNYGNYIVDSYKTLDEYRNASALAPATAAVVGEVIAPLTADEQKLREESEAVIRENIETHLTSGFLIGEAMTPIITEKLYRSTHANLESYVTETFGISRIHAYQLMNAAAVNMATKDVQLESGVILSIRTALSIKRGIAGLLPDTLKKAEIMAYERQASKFVLQLIVDTAPLVDGKPDVRPAHIDRVFSVLQDVVKSGAVEFEGEQIPVTAAALIVDSQVAEENDEMNKRRKQALGEEIKNRDERLKAPQSNGTKKTSGKTAADIAAGLASDENETADEMTTTSAPQLLTTCTGETDGVPHGAVAIYSFMHGGVRLTCGCVFKRYDEGMLYEGNEPLTEEEEQLASQLVHIQA